MWFFLLYLPSTLLKIFWHLLSINPLNVSFLLSHHLFKNTHTHIYNLSLLCFKFVHSVNFYTSSPAGRSHSALNSTYPKLICSFPPIRSIPNKTLFLHFCFRVLPQKSDHLRENPGKHHQHLLLILSQLSDLQFSSVTESCPTFCEPVDWSMPGFPVHHQPLEFAQTHAHRVGDAIQPSHPLSFPSPPAFNLFQHQGLS